MKKIMLVWAAFAVFSAMFWAITGMHFWAALTQDREGFIRGLILFILHIAPGFYYMVQVDL